MADHIRVEEKLKPIISVSGPQWLKEKFEQAAAVSPYKMSEIICHFLVKYIEKFEKENHEIKWGGKDDKDRIKKEKEYYAKIKV